MDFRSGAHWLVFATLSGAWPSHLPSPTVFSFSFVWMAACRRTHVHRGLDALSNLTFWIDTCTKSKSGLRQQLTTSRGGQVFWLIPTLIPCCRLVPTYSIFESMSGTSLMGSPNTGGTTPFWTWKGNWTPTTFLCQFRSDLTNAGVDSAEWIGTATAAIAISLLVADTTALPLLLDASLENAADTYSPCTFAAAPAGLAATGQLLHPGGRVLLRKHKRAERSLDATYDATPGVVAAAIILSAVSKNARYL